MKRDAIVFVLGILLALLAVMLIGTLSDDEVRLGDGRVTDSGTLDPVGKLAGQVERPEGPTADWWSRATQGIPEEYLP